MADKYNQSSAAAMIAQATLHTAVVPRDAVDLASQPRAIYVLTAGNVAVRDAAGNNITYPVVAGQAKWQAADPEGRCYSCELVNS
jgi:hypothetical protein